MKPYVILLSLFFFATCACKKETLTYAKEDVKIEIITGEEWLHDFPLFWGFSKKNPPQFAIWLESPEGDYISTVYVTQKIATEGWIANDGNRRKEALPHWCHSRNVVYEDGLLLPTKENPFTDAITGATPKCDKELKLDVKNLSDRPFVVKAEFNHSVDFNDNYPENASESDENYSGGSEGSGQPAVVYANTVDFTKQTEYSLKLIGHSSSDGTDGTIHTTLTTLTTAKHIVKEIKISMIK